MSRDIRHVLQQVLCGCRAKFTVGKQPFDTIELLFFYCSSLHWESPVAICTENERHPLVHGEDDSEIPIPPVYVTQDDKSAHPLKVYWPMPPHFDAAVMWTLLKCVLALTVIFSSFLIQKLSCLCWSTKTQTFWSVCLSVCPSIQPRSKRWNNTWARCLYRKNIFNPINREICPPLFNVVQQKDNIRPILWKRSIITGVCNALLLKSKCVLDCSESRLKTRWKRCFRHKIQTSQAPDPRVRGLSAKS